MNDERAANAVDRKIGQRVRSRRLEIGMSQERLAELLGVTFQQVQKYEKGVNRIAASRLYDIAAALDMPAARFFEGLSVGRSAGVAEILEVRLLGLCQEFLFVEPRLGSHCNHRHTLNVSVSTLVNWPSSVKCSGE